MIKEVNIMYNNYLLYRIDNNNEIEELKILFAYYKKWIDELLKYLLYYSRTYLVNKDKLMLMKEYIDKSHFIHEETILDIIDTININIGIIDIIKPMAGDYFNLLIPYR